MKSIGWTPVKDGGYPYRPILGKRSHMRLKPTTVYQTEAKAISYSPIRKATEVFIDETTISS